MRFTSALRDLANTRPCQSPCPPFQARHASVKLRNYRIASGSWTPTRGLNHQAGFRKDIGFKCLADAQRSAAFPAGKKQAKVQLPACFIIIDVASVNSNLDSIGAAISAGATGILLTADNRTGTLFLNTIMQCSLAKDVCLLCSASDHTLPERLQKACC